MPVHIERNGAQIAGVTINVSEGGMYVFAAAKLSLGDEVEIAFRPPEKKKVVRASGIVRRRAVYLFGIEFLNGGVEATRAGETGLGALKAAGGVS